MKSRGPDGYGFCRLTCQAGVVRLNGDLDHLSILSGNGVTLAAMVARDGSGVKCHVPRLGELSGRVGDEADTTSLVLIQGLAPCIGAEAMFSSDLGIGGGLFSYTQASLTATTKTLPAVFNLSLAMYPGTWLPEHVGEKAAGTPMTRPLPEASSLDRLTLLPGDVSKSSTSGTASPSLTFVPQH